MLPAERAEVMQVAAPERSSGWVPQVVMPPPVKATVPASGVGVTVAVKVTLWPTVEEGAEETTAVLVVVCAEAGTASPSTTSRAAARAAPRRPVTAINRPLPCRFMIDPDLS